MPDFPASVATLAAVNDTLTVDVRDAASAVISVIGGPAGAVGLNLLFEVSNTSTDGVDGAWHGVGVARSNANVIELASGAVAPAAAAGLAYAWELSVAGYTWLRIKATAVTSGSGIVTVTPSRAAIDPAPGAQTHAVTQSGTWTVTITTPPGTPYSLVSTAGTNAALVKLGGVSLFEIVMSNPTATAAVVKLFNKATAPVAGTDVPVLTQSVAPGQTVALAFGQIGKRFASGLGIAITANAIASDATAAVAGVQVHATYV